MRLCGLLVVLTVIGCVPAQEREPERNQGTTQRLARAVGQTGADVDADQLPTDQVKAELVSMKSSWVFPPDTSRPQVGVELVPAKGWHIYWLNPGDSGLPTRFELRQKERLLEHQARMPVPKRKVSPGDIVSYAFDGATQFFIQSSQAKISETLAVTAHWLACAETCIKGSKTVRVEPILSEQSDWVSTTGDEIQAAWAALPLTRHLNWKRERGMLIYEGPPQARLELFPHTELYRRLDGHTQPYCLRNRCQLPFSVLSNSEQNTQLLATLQIKTPTSNQAYHTDIMKGIKP